MLYEIKNDKLSVSADTFGAELHSIKLDGKEYLILSERDVLAVL